MKKSVLKAMKITQELIDYIREVMLPYINEALTKGFRKEEIYSALLDAGHEKDFIDLCFAVYDNEVHLESLKEWPPSARETEHENHLKEFIEKHLARGYKPEEIKTILVQLGEKEDLINEVLNEVLKNKEHFENEKNATKGNEPLEVSQSNTEEITNTKLDEVNNFKFSLKWTSEQKGLFFTNLVIWLILTILFTVSVRVEIFLPALSFLPIVLYPILDLFLKRRTFIVVGVLSALFIPMILYLENYTPDLETLFLINILFFLIYYDTAYVGFYRKVFKRD